jgi:protoheme IX farnesyltransferase
MMERPSLGEVKFSRGERLRAAVTLLKLRIFSLLWAESVVGLILASGGSIDPVRLFVLSVAGLLSTGGSGALNNYLDRDIDAKMARTSTRPIPSGRIRPSEALLLGVTMGAAGVVLAYLALSPTSGMMVAAGLGTYVFVYTYLLKRRTPWNIVVGGASGSFAFLAGWAAAAPLGVEAILIGVVIFLWTPSHFWALAIRAMGQYRGAGVPMLPVVAGVKATSEAIMVNSVALVASSLALYALGYFGLVYLVVAIVLGGLLLSSDYVLLMSGSAAMAWRAYKFTAPYLLMLSIAMVADRAAFHLASIL